MFFDAFRRLISESENEEFATEEVDEHSGYYTAEVGKVERGVAVVEYESEEEIVEKQSWDKGKTAYDEEFAVKYEGDSVVLGLFPESPKMVQKVVLRYRRDESEYRRDAEKYLANKSLFSFRIDSDQQIYDVGNDHVSDDAESSGHAEAHELEFCQSVEKIL